MPEKDTKEHKNLKLNRTEQNRNPRGKAVTVLALDRIAKQWLLVNQDVTKQTVTKKN